MSFTGKATYSAGVGLAELAEDLSDIISIVSPYETPLLCHLGDAPQPAGSTYHEWLEDIRLPNGANEAFEAEAELFHARTGLLAPGKSVPAAIATDTYDEERKAAWEEWCKDPSRLRVRKGNWTQRFTANVRVHGAALELRKLSVADELDYQKQERTRELLRDLECMAVRGIMPSDPGRRTMRGIIALLTSNVFEPSEYSPNPVGLTEAELLSALGALAGQGVGQVDTIVVNGFQKRRINGFMNGCRPDDASYRDLVSLYESDFGVCRVILTRAMPADSVLLLDSTRINVLPLAGQNFHYRPQAAGPDYEAGEIRGEYTLELRNENAHGIIAGLAAA